MASTQVPDLPRTAPTPPTPRPAPGPETGSGGRPPSLTAVLRHRHCARLPAAALLGRLPLGLVPVALLLAARADGHSLATAGLLAAVYGLAPAVGLPLLGRLADTRGLLLPAAAGAAVVAAALTTLAAAGTDHLPLALGCAALAGAGCPPLEGGLRALWPALLPDAAHVRAAYALDASVQEIVYVAGPALAVTAAGLTSPHTALALAAAATVAGTAAFLATPAARTRPTPTAHPRTNRTGVLRTPALRPILAALVCTGAALGALDVAALAAADHHHTPWLAGALPAVFSAAGLAGGAVFARRQPATTRWQLPALAGAFAVAWLPLTAPAPPLVLLACAALPGALFVPLLTAAGLTVTALAGPGAAAEATGWISSAMRLGLAAGTALAGPAGGHLALPLPAAGAAALLLLLLVVPAARPTRAVPDPLAP